MILHVDMDAFYTSVEIRDNPELAGKPVVVGGTPQGRGVVAAASYAAREYGIHSAMSAARAVRLCPHAIFLKPRISYYAEISHQIREIFFRYTPAVEPLSLDEAFLDVDGSERLFGPSVDIARLIKQEIAGKLGLIASVGVAPNKFLAKLASDLEKPDGLVVVPPDAIQEFLDPLPVKRIWGVGRVTEKVFDRIGVKTVADLRRLEQDVLQRYFGDHGQHLWKLARGIDDRKVIPDREAKSVSHETTFSEDIAELSQLRARAAELTDQVARRLRRADRKGHTVTVKMRFFDFRTITRSITLPHATSETAVIWDAVSEILSNRLPEHRPPVRLLGVGVTGFSGNKSAQLQLFDTEPASSQLDQAADRIRERFGGTSLGRGSSLFHRKNDDHRPGQLPPY